MRIETFKNYNAMHTWTGIVAGLFLYVCFLAGALTMFQTPLNRWVLQEDASLPPIPEASYDTLIQQVLQRYPEAGADLLVHLPNAMPQSAPLTWLAEDPDTHVQTRWMASLDDNGRLLVERGSVSAAGEFLDQLHRTAGIPGHLGHESVGTLIMGLICGLYFLALVSGLIVFLPTWYSDFLTMRRGENRKRFWLDLHNILGLSALPFHIIIALTTFVFAFHDPIYGSLQKWVYGDSSMFGRPPVTDAPHDLTSLATVAELKEALYLLEPSLQPEELHFRRLNTPAPMVLVGGELPGDVQRGAEYTYAVAQPFTAEYGYLAQLPSHGGGYGRAVNSFFALHLGNFGGNTTRWLYFLLGVSGAMVFLSGNVLWIEARRKRRKSVDGDRGERRDVRAMASLTAGVGAGTPLAIAAMLLAARLLPHEQLPIEVWQNGIYYVVFLMSVLWAFLRPPLTAAKELLWVLMVILVALLLVPLVWIAPVSGAPLASVAATVVVLAMALGATLYWLRLRAQKLPADSVWVCQGR